MSHISARTTRGNARTTISKRQGTLGDARRKLFVSQAAFDGAFKRTKDALRFRGDCGNFVRALREDAAGGLEEGFQLIEVHCVSAPAVAKDPCQIYL